jgi:hypothetical protein
MTWPDDLAGAGTGALKAATAHRPALAMWVSADGSLASAPGLPTGARPRTAAECAVKVCPDFPDSRANGKTGGICGLERGRGSLQLRRKCG